MAVATESGDLIRISLFSSQSANRLRGTVAAIAIGLSAAALLFYSPSPAEVNAVAEPIPQPTVTQRITVHVSGAVARPGLVEVASSARVADVIAAAGGVTAQAVLQSINLAAPVRSGEQIVVPAAGSGAMPVEPPGLIRLNFATAAELEQIPGVGPVLASRIIEYRNEVGGFSAVEDLLDVSGIGEAKLAALRDLVTVP